MVKSIWNFINYWYFRYLLVTELYMVEKWERVMIHIVFFIILSIISLFNTTVILGLVSWGIDSLLHGPEGVDRAGINPTIRNEL